MKDSENWIRKLNLIGVFFLLLSKIVYPQVISDLPAYKNVDQPIEERITDLLERMTLEEKVELLCGVSDNSTPDLYAKVDDPNTIWQALDFQSRTKKNIRLGIPELIMTDGPLGPKGKGGSTNYSAAINFAATFDPDLINKVGLSMGAETRNLGFNTLLAPCINISRSPFNGRNFEAFGEDPYLTSRLGVAFIIGVQSQKVVSCAKHFIANNQEWNRMTVDVKVDERTLNEIYLPAFKAAVEEANVWTVMSAYNKVNGIYCGENKYILNDILKKKWNFTGAVISDWGGTHHTLPTLLGGLDLEMPTGKVMDKESIFKELDKGTVSVSLIDDKVKRIFRVMFNAGLFDESVGNYGGQTDTEYRRKLALKVAEKSIVLLKNSNNLLPVKNKNIKKIAIIGPNGNVARMTGSGSADNRGHYGISLLDGVKNFTQDCEKVKFERGIAVAKTDLKVIPSTLLLLPKEKGDKQGVWAEYFNNPDLKGKPDLTRKENQIDFDWGYGRPKTTQKNPKTLKNSTLVNSLPTDDKGGSPDPNIIQKDEWSARWKGRLISPGKGWYDIGVKADNGFRLFLNRKLIVDAWTAQTPGKYNVAQFKFEENKIYDLKVEFYENWGSSRCILGMEKFKAGDAVLNAVKLAQNADMVIMGMGLNVNMEGEGSDRSSLDLPRAQIDLIKRISKVNKNVVVVLYGGGPITMEEWKDNVPVILEAFYPGQEGGNALANIIFGKVNPSGKLPVTFPKKREDSPDFGTYPGRRNFADYKEGIFVGYRGYDKKNVEPLFPFGYGLSYTTFEYADLKLSANKIDKNDSLKVYFTLKNTGETDGDEIVQLYIHDQKSSVEREIKALKRFKRVGLKAGESKVISFEIDKTDLSFYDVKNKKWIAEKGKFDVWIGASSRDLKLVKKFSLK